MRQSSEHLPLPAWILIILLFFLGTGGLISGALLFVAPDGKLIGFTPSLLSGSPFSNYLVPGIILFLFVGVYQIFAGYSLLKKPAWNWPDRLTPFKGYHWAWTTSWVAAVIMLVWIIVETALLGYISLLQPIIALWGIILIFLTFLPSTQRYYYKRNR